MYKKASTRTGGSSLSGWSTRKQTEPKIDLKQTKLVRDWDKIQPRRKRGKAILPQPQLLKAHEVKPKDNFRQALIRSRRDARREAQRARREAQRKS